VASCAGDAHGSALSLAARRGATADAASEPWAAVLADHRVDVAQQRAEVVQGAQVTVGHGVARHAVCRKLNLRGQQRPERLNHQASVPRVIPRLGGPPPHARDAREE
jgi:hypothetical protein